MESDIFKLFLAESAISSLIHLAWLGRDSDYLPYLMVIPHHTLPTYLRYRPYHKPTKGLCAHLTLPTFRTYFIRLLCSALPYILLSSLFFGLGSLCTIAIIQQHRPRPELVLIELSAHCSHCCTPAASYLRLHPTKSALPFCTLPHSPSQIGSSSFCSSVVIFLSGRPSVPCVFLSENSFFTRRHSGASLAGPLIPWLSGCQTST